MWGLGAVIRRGAWAAALAVALLAPTGALAAEGDLNYVGSAPAGSGAGGVTVSPDNLNVYVTNRYSHSITVFSRNTTNGTLTLVETEADGAAGGSPDLMQPRRLDFSPNGQFLYVSASEDDAINVFERVAGGALTYRQSIRDSSNPALGLDRAMGVEVSPDGNFVYVTGENEDAINVFSRDSTTGLLTFQSKVTDADTAGTSGLDAVVGVGVTPDGDHLYATSYLGDALTAWRRSEVSGALAFIETEKDGVGGVDGINGADGPAISSNGLSVYATGDVDDAVAAFSRNPSNGQLTWIEQQKDNPGIGPPNGLDGATLLAISPDQKNLYAPGESEPGNGGGNGGLAIFSRLPTTAPLTFTQVFVEGFGITGMSGPEGVDVAPDGRHVYVGSGVSGTVTIFTRIPDVTAPETAINTGPTSIPPTNDNTPTFTWSSADTFIAQFECSLDGAPFTTTNCTSGSPRPTVSEGAHTLQVRARDTADNVDATPASRAFTVDTVAPDTTITGPSGPTNDATPTFSFGSNESPVTFQCSLDGAAFTTVGCTSGAALPTQTPGSHTFQVRAHDAATNFDATPASINFTVDTVAPDTTLTGPSGPTNDATPTFAFGSNESPVTFECSFDGAAFTTTGCTSGAALPTQTQGPHTIGVRARDAATNVDASPATSSYTVDTVLPDTTITLGPADGSTIDDPTPAFSFTSNEGSVTFQCSINGAAFTAVGCTSGADLAPLAQGTNTFAVRARDAATNLDASPATRTFIVDTGPPETTIDSGPGEGSTTNDPTPSFGFSASETAQFECRVDGGGFAACTSGGDLATLADGPHTFAVRARDGVGNLDPSPATRTFSLDATAPDAQVLKSKKKVKTKKKKAKAKLTLGSDDPTALLTCAVDKKPAAPCGPKAKFKVKAKPGKGKKHTVTVSATDPAGNTDPTPAVVKFRAIRR